MQIFIRYVRWQVALGVPEHLSPGEDAHGPLGQNVRNDFDRFLRHLGQIFQVGGRVALNSPKLRLPVQWVI